MPRGESKGESLHLLNLHSPPTAPPPCNHSILPQPIHQILLQSNQTPPLHPSTMSQQKHVRKPNSPPPHRPPKTLDTTNSSVSQTFTTQTFTTPSASPSSPTPSTAKTANPITTKASATSPTSLRSKTCSTARGDSCPRWLLLLMMGMG